ncbi:MAG: cobalamin-binding protein [Chthoniobacterales bacterium]
MPRIVSLVPAATEIAAALGLLDSIVGVSHECDFPVEVNNRPRVTSCPVHNVGLTSAEVDEWVRRALRDNGTIYTINEPLLRELQPEIILTQKLCDVCAVGYGTVARMAAMLPAPPQVVNLEPSSLTDIFEDIRRVAHVCGVANRGEALVGALLDRVQAVQNRALTASMRPRCFVMEWIDPVFCSGHWSPELIEIAGGYDPLGRKHKPSAEIKWQAVLDARPDVIVLALCGYNVARARQDYRLLSNFPGLYGLPAVQNRRVHIVDANAYFSRPGPRIVDTIEILAGILHPEIFPEFAQAAEAYPAVLLAN